MSTQNLEEVDGSEASNDWTRRCKSITNIDETNDDFEECSSWWGMTWYHTKQITTTVFCTYSECSFLASLTFLGVLVPQNIPKNRWKNMFWVVVSNIFYCQPYFGEDSHFDSYFSDGLKPPTTVVFFLEANFVVLILKRQKRSTYCTYLFRQFQELFFQPRKGKPASCQK